MLSGFYGLSYNPFDKQVTMPEVRFQSTDFKEMSKRLNFIKDTRGIGVFTAPPGFGKTYALRCFAENLNPSLYQMAYICLTTVSVTELYKQICGVLNIEGSSQRSVMFKSIQERLLYLYKDKRRPLILAVDEAHDLDSRALKDFKMLLNNAFDSLYCFTLLLIGEPHLNQDLMKPVHEALMQRITIHYNFLGLSSDETHAYIIHKITAAGGAACIIEDSAINAVYGFSHGNPRIIDNVMSDALTFGPGLEKKIIDTDLILAAVENQSFI